MNVEKIVADRLEKITLGGFDVFKVSREAFKIYQEFGLSLTQDLDRVLLSLMVMEEGPEFEVTEQEFRSLLSEIRKI
ncbi:hypothetical protein HF319_02125 [Xanthomonas sp. Kuri4-1]